MNIVKAIRAGEWWGYKILPLLAIGYATAVRAGKDLAVLALWLLFLVLGIVIGAIYVSLINDLTDMEEDQASGKHNRMTGIPPRLRGPIIVANILLGLLTMYFLLPDRTSIVLYLLSWIAFSLYSIPPVRLKKRGAWGVIADACGAHVFPSLFLVTAVSHFCHLPLDWVWLAATGVWALAYGLRGILWHQFSDRVNDLRIGMNTFATRSDPHSFRKQSLLILLAELLGLSVMLWRIGKPLPVVFLLLYGLFVMICTKKLGISFIVIMSPSGRPFHILMGDYYQVFFPLSLLVTSAWVYPHVWIVLIAHMLLFLKTNRAILSYLWAATK